MKLQDRRRLWRRKDEDYYQAMFALDTYEVVVKSIMQLEDPTEGSGMSKKKHKLNGGTIAVGYFISRKKKI